MHLMLHAAEPRSWQMALLQNFGPSICNFQMQMVCNMLQLCLLRSRMRCVNVGSLCLNSVSCELVMSFLLRVVCRRMRQSKQAFVHCAQVYFVIQRNATEQISFFALCLIR